MASKDAKQSSVPQIDRGSLKRVLGAMDLFAVGYGDLGSSIYYALGITAFFALGATPIAMLLGGLVFVWTALSYAELSSCLQEAGGSASYARRAFNDLISFIAGWGLLLDYILTIAISAFTVGPYLANFFPFLSKPDMQIIFTISLILILLIINMIGVKQSTRTSFILMLFTVITQIFIIVLGGFTIGDIGKVISQLWINQNASWSPTWSEFLKGTAMAMVAYTGVESIVQLGAETKKPGKTVPKAIMITMAVLLFMYVGISYIGFSVLSPYELGHQYETQALVGIVSRFPIGSSIFVPWMGILAAMSLFVAANAGLIGSSRLAFNMGEFYQLPRFFYSIYPRFKTPCLALIFFAVLASCIVAASRGKMSFLADLYNFGAQIAFFSTQVSLLVLRVKKPHLKRPFKVPLNIKIKGYEFPITAILGAIASFAAWTLVVVTKPHGRYLGGAWIIFGLIMYFMYRRKTRISPISSLTIHKIKIPDLKPVKIQKILLPLKSSFQVEAIQVACEMAKLHHAKITAIHVVEVPFTVPLDAPLRNRVAMGSAVLKTAEALALEAGVEISLEITRARNISEAIITIADKDSFDLIFLDSGPLPAKAQSKTWGKTLQNLCKNPPCRLWIYYGHQSQTLVVHSYKNQESYK